MHQFAAVGTMTWPTRSSVATKLAGSFSAAVAALR